MKKKIIAGILIAATLTMSIGLSACGGKKERKKDGYDNLRIYMQAGAEYAGAEPDSVWTAIEEATKTVISYVGPSSDYYTTLNAVMNDVMDKDRPDIVFAVPDQTGGAYYKWAGEYEFLVDMDAIIAAHPGEFPHIEALFQTERYSSLEWNNAHRLVPWLTTDNVYSIYYRTDWLKNVGEVDEDGNAKIPETLEDFERVLYKFRNEDPDGNGQKDTWGISPADDSFCWNQLYHAFGVCEGWDYDQDGNVIYMGTQEEMKSFLQWANKLYEMDLIEPQYNSNTGTKDREKFKDGKVGILLTDAEQHVKWVMSEFESKQGENIVEMGAAPVGTGEISSITGCVLGKKGAQGSSTRGAWWGGFAITTSCKKPLAAMRFLDYLISYEGSMLNTYGVEGKHYSISESGEITMSAEQLSTRRKEKRFATSKSENGVEANGRYMIGSNMEGGVITIKDGKVNVYCQANVIDYHFADLVQQAADKCVPFVDKIPETVIYPETVSDSITLIEEQRESKFNLFIMGKFRDIAGANADFNKAWNVYVTAVNNKQLETVKRVVKETATAYGYTA